VEEFRSKSVSDCTRQHTNVPVKHGNGPCLINRVAMLAERKQQNGGKKLWEKPGWIYIASGNWCKNRFKPAPINKNFPRFSQKESEKMGAPAFRAKQRRTARLIVRRRLPLKSVILWIALEVGQMRVADFVDQIMIVASRETHRALDIFCSAIVQSVDWISRSRWLVGFGRGRERFGFCSISLQKRQARGFLRRERDAGWDLGPPLRAGNSIWAEDSGASSSVTGRAIPLMPSHSNGQSYPPAIRAAVDPARSRPMGPLRVPR